MSGPFMRRPVLWWQKHYVVVTMGGDIPLRYFWTLRAAMKRMRGAFHGSVWHWRGNGWYQVYP